MKAVDTLATALTVVLFTLKLLGKISISWWLVFAPVWASVAVGLAFVILAAILAAIVRAISG